MWTYTVQSMTAKQYRIYYLETSMRTYVHISMEHEPITHMIKAYFSQA